MALTATSTEAGATATPVDVVAIRRADTGEQVFAGARPMTANVYEVAKALEHPLEDASTIIDHLVFLPVEIEMPLMVIGEEAPDVYGQIRELFRSGILLTVQTRARTYDNMLLTAVPHDERPEQYDALTITLQLREAILVEATYGGAVAVAPPPTAQGRPRTPTQRRGAQQTTPAPAVPQERAGSILYRWTRGG